MDGTQNQSERQSGKKAYMAEEHNGLTRLLRAWPIVVTIVGIFAAIVGWQFLSLYTMVDKLQAEHSQAMHLTTMVPQLAATLAQVDKEQARRAGPVAEVAQLRLIIQDIQQQISTRAALLAVVDSRMGNIERDIQNIRSLVEDIRRVLPPSPRTPTLGPPP